MADEVDITPIRRGADGRIVPGSGPLHRKGSRRVLPQWFLEGGEPALRHLLAIALGEKEDSMLSRAKVCLEVVERVYGRTPAAPEEVEAREEGVAALLLALAQRPR